MLRFDIPNISGNVYRLNAFWVFATMAAMYFFPFPFGIVMVAILTIETFIRGFINPHKGVVYNINHAFLKMIGVEELPMNAGSKMFTDKLIFVAGVVIMGLFYAESSGMVTHAFWHYPVMMMGIASMVDTVIGFCVACWAYGLFYKLSGKTI